MCLAKVYLGGNGEHELLMEDITSIKSEGGKLTVTTLFGDKQEIEANIKEIDFRGSRVFLARVNG